MTKAKSVLLPLFLFLFIHPTQAQTRFTVSGTVKEKKSGESLIGATVYLLEMAKSGTMSNGYGFYSISAPPGTYTIEAWHEKLGTMEQKVTIWPKETKEITFSFKPSGAAATG